MKKLLCGVLCAMGILAVGCDMDIPADEVGSFTSADFCALTGGEFLPSAKDSSEKRCFCGGTECGEGVSCVVDSVTRQYVCMGERNLDYPEYTCTIKDMTICFNRVVNLQQTGTSIGEIVGYVVECDGANWTSPKACPNNYSCKTYTEHALLYSTQCGECLDDGVNCIRGQKVDKSGGSN